MNQESFENYSDSEEIEIEAIGIDVSSQPIELYKLFKVANLVGGGGEAKHVITEGYVAVNGELETRKRRKMYDGDFFEFNQEYYVVVCDQPPVELEQEVEEQSVTAGKRCEKSSNAKKQSSSKKSDAKNSQAATRKNSGRDNSKPSKNSKSGKSDNSKPAQGKTKPDKTKPSKSGAEGQFRQRSGVKDPNSGRGSIDFF